MNERCEYLDTIEALDIDDAAKRGICQRTFSLWQPRAVTNRPHIEWIGRHDALLFVFDSSLFRDGIKRLRMLR
jgi:hypothetical protein